MLQTVELRMQKPEFKQESYLTNLFDQIVHNFSDNQSQIEETLQKPGLALKNSQNQKYVLELFSILAPRILRLISDLQNNVDDSFVVELKGFKPLENWIECKTYSNGQTIEIAFEESLALNVNFTEITAREVFYFMKGTKEFIENEGVTPFIRFAAGFVANNMVMTPVVMLSELLYFLIERKQSFQPTPYRRIFNKNRERMEFNMFIDQQKSKISDFAGIQFDYVESKNVQGISFDSITDLVKKLDSQEFQESYFQLEEQEKQIIQSINENTKTIEQIGDLTSNLEKNAQNEELNDLSKSIKREMAEEKTEEIPPVIVDMKEKVDAYNEKTDQSIENINNTISKQELPILFEKNAPEIKQALQNKIEVNNLLQSMESFLQLMLSSIKENKFELEEINDLPKDIMIRVAMIKTQSSIKQRITKLEILKISVEVKKLKSSKIKIEEANTYVKRKQEIINLKIMEHIQAPLQQIEALKEKGKRILENEAKLLKIFSNQESNAKIAKQTQENLESLFGEYSKSNVFMVNNFRQSQDMLIEIRDNLESNKLSLLGFSKEIDQNFTRSLTRLQQENVTRFEKAIFGYNQTLLGFEERLNTVVTPIIETLTTIKDNISQVMGSLVDIAKKLESLDSEVTIIKELSQKTLIGQTEIISKIEKLVLDLQNKGFLQIAKGKEEYANTLKLIDEQITENNKNITDVNYLSRDLLQLTKNDITKSTTNVNNALSSYESILNRITPLETKDTANKFDSMESVIKKINGLEEINIEKVNSIQQFNVGMDSIAAKLEKIKQQNEFISGINTGEQSISEKLRLIKEKNDNLSRLNTGEANIEAKLMEIYNKNIELTNFNVGLSDLETKINEIRSISTKSKELNVDDIKKKFNEVRNFNELIVKQIEEDSRQIALGNTKLSQTVSQMEQVLENFTQNPQSSLKKLQEVIETIYMNTVQLSPYVNEVGNSQKTVIETLREIKETLNVAVNGIKEFSDRGNGGDDREKEDRRKEIVVLKEKLVNMTSKAEILEKAYFGLAKNVEEIFHTEKTWVNKLLKNINEIGLFKGKKSGNIELVEFYVKQVQENYKKAMGILLPFLKVGFEGENEISRPLMEKVNELYGTPKRTIDFEWWKTSDKVIKL